MGGRQDFATLKLESANLGRLQKTGERKFCLEKNLQKNWVQTRLSPRVGELQKSGLPKNRAKLRKRKREDARAALDGYSVLSTGSRLEIFCDSERWYPATVMAREEDGDGRIVHEVEYDGYSGRRWWHMLDDERWRAVPEQAACVWLLELFNINFGPNSCASVG
ncbi:hypothetical protein EMIHUDRAFT_201624 [Emiliania huxleyi CCMP1516]|uniref:Agenet domain-containing protein n=2 Tax=Emiliania huxleyi TaxID=2903 RepID=A0A0D3KIB3_EMIH1|nr:hypothetical protein EMIHUDRAFT_201624 [Emiliania huxleyi CCMP1516]EOD35498.1 hypothetical protein EMIHUDRAFT_201624 [Emiliania huxleyi CCMP1516]|eukprot:XP_005787927.1 hypothetical protein EMIHUDRAFT_201624 [Emiliania huxleyi CCMP1516]